jgi:hypothetical protein
MTHGVHEHGVCWGAFEGKLSFKMSAGCRLCTLQENPFFGSRRSKLDHLTVHAEVLAKIGIRHDHDF